MKQLSTFGNRDFILEDEEAENIKKLLREDSKGFIDLRSGDMVNISAIESIGDVETEPYFGGNRMNKSKTRVLVDGEWKIFAGRQDQIEYKPKTNNLSEKKLTTI